MAGVVHPLVEVVPGGRGSAIMALPLQEPNMSHEHTATARTHSIDHSASAPPVAIPPGHVGEFVIPGTGRMVWWTGRVAIGLLAPGTITLPVRTAYGSTFWRPGYAAKGSPTSRNRGGSATKLASA
jgi:hypothetical protein